jgi:hypothetical protein
MVSCEPCCSGYRAALLSVSHNCLNLVCLLLYALLGNFDASGWPMLGVESAENSPNHSGRMMTWRCSFN